MSTLDLGLGPRAYVVSNEFFGEGGESRICFAESHEQARSLAVGVIGDDYVDMRAKRAAEWDIYAWRGVPDEALWAAGWWQGDPHSPMCISCGCYQWDDLTCSAVCGDCEQCASCGCDDDCPGATNGGTT